MLFEAVEKKCERELLGLRGRARKLRSVLNMIEECRSRGIIDGKTEATVATFFEAVLSEGIANSQKESG